MPEMRQDPTTKEWVIIASERSKRPRRERKLKKGELPPYEPSCPFCPGNEHLNPKEVLRYPDAETGQDWQIRVIRNKYPALIPEGSTQRRQEVDFFTKLDGVGVHEVIIESPSHNSSIALMEEREVENILLAYKQRYSELSREPTVKLIIIFKNHGERAGTSLIHPHAQLVATPVAPADIRRRFEVAIAHYDDTGRCLYQDIVDHELKVGERIVMDTERFVVFHPFASRAPFETWIIPKRQQACFGVVPTDDFRDLARVLRTTLLKLYRLLDDPDFNYVIRCAPVGDENKHYYLWHICIIPRLSQIAGFEIGTSIFINSAPPEETAESVRKLKV